MTAKHGPCRLPTPSVSLCVLLALLGQAPVAHAAGAGRPGSPLDDGAGGGLSLAAADADVVADGNELYLEVVLNQAPTGRLARFVERDGRFLASAATLREVGLRWPGSDAASGLIPLEAIPALHAEYHAAGQRMLLQVPVDMLERPPERLGFVQPPPPRPDPAMRSPGLILNYDLHAYRAGGAGSVAGWSEARLFGLGAGIWSTAWNTRLDTGAPASGSRRDSVRLDTDWRLDFPDSMISLHVGDGITGAVPWSRPTRFGGIRLARDFSLQPYRITAPLASFAGDAALPSTVDLFIDGIRQASQPVAPGQFRIDSVPSLSGTGTAHLVVTDINGLSRTIDFPLYGTPRLLEPGLSDWSLELGWIRRDYGLSSFSYADDPMVGGSLRRGLSAHLTMEAHAEATRGLEMAGLGAVWLPGPRSGVFDAAIAHSRTDGVGGGRQHGIGYQWNARWFSLNASSTRRSAGFRDAASLEGSPLPRRTDQAFLGLNTPLGQWSGGYVHQAYPDSPLGRYLTLGWSRQFPHRNSVNLLLNRDLESDRGYGVLLYWSMPLDRLVQVSASARRHDGADSLAVQASRSIDGDAGGWGWRAQATTGSGGSHGAQVQLDQLGRYGQWHVGAADHGSGGTSAWAGASGGLLWMAGRARAMRRVENAFAMVSTQGVADVPVRLENRVVGHTDRHGLLLVERLNPWQNNRLSIDPLSLPPDMRIETAEMQAVPAGRSGVLARFPMHPILWLQAGVVDVQGRPLPAGSPVWLDAADPAADRPLTVVGHDGLLHLQDPPPHARLRIRVDGRYCEIVLPGLQDNGGFVELEGAVCQ